MMCGGHSVVGRVRSITNRQARSFHETSANDLVPFAIGSVWQIEGGRTVTPVRFCDRRGGVAW